MAKERNREENGKREENCRNQKLARNTRWLHGLKEQLPTYMKSEKVKEGIFAIVMYEEEDREKVNDLQAEAQIVKDTLGFNIKIVVIDAQAQKSASQR